jgi:RHS repeat-associated protein
MAKVNVFRFSTKYLDNAVNLYCYGYRYYVPDLGRWLNRDPVGEKGGPNLYSFTFNHPTITIDPFGLEEMPAIYQLSKGLSSNPEGWGYSYYHSLYEQNRYSGDIKPFLNYLLDAAAGGNIGYTWRTPTIPIGPGGIVSLLFKASVSGKMVDCYSTQEKLIKKKGMFEGELAVSANIGSGYLDDSGAGAYLELFPADKCRPCKTTISEIVYDLAAMAGAGIGKFGWSVIGQKPIGQCSASLECKWTFVSEGLSVQTGAGATGLRIAIIGSGKSTGTVSNHDINWK